ncbi:C39 family peptidase [Tepidibacter mesophilus]|uniref:C39 family peptidase n=1 Tax=Tepidibacter mesophilus TaxID=655607 RepID=UPI001651A0A1|nr:C39 family peptidase [Tepidibacter mesophilus]
MNKLIKKLSLALTFTLMFSTAAYAEAGLNLDKKEELKEELTQQYQNDEEFQIEKEELGEEIGQEMIDYMAERTLQRPPIRVKRSGNGSIFLVDIPYVKQINGYYCGPASVLQTLYAMNKEDEVSGSSDSSKQKTLGNSMGTKSGMGTYVYKVKNEINKYSDNDYVYKKGSDMTIDDFEDNLTYSLMYDAAPILHSKTKYLGYYNGKNLGHYINVDFINRSGDDVGLMDCNYDSDYSGHRDVSLEEAYNAISKESERYLIYLP